MSSNKYEKINTVFYHSGISLLWLLTN